MKKFLFILAFSFIINILIILVPDNMDGMLFGLMPIFIIFLLCPLVFGILFILVQDKNRSYEFIPGWLIGSCVNIFIIMLIFGFHTYLQNGYLSKHLFSLYFLTDAFLPLLALHVIGGFIGLVIRGTTLLISKKHRKI